MAVEEQRASRIQFPKLDSTLLTLGFVILFVLIVGFFVSQLEMPRTGYGGLNLKIIANSLKELLPALISIIVMAVSLEVAIYTTIAKDTRRWIAFPIFMLLSVIFVLYMIAGRQLDNFGEVPGELIKASVTLEGLRIPLNMFKVDIVLPLSVTILLFEAIVFGLLHLVNQKFALPYALLAPAAVGLVVFVVYPFFYDILLSASDANLKTIACYSVDPKIQKTCKLDTNKDKVIQFGEKYKLEFALDNYQRVFFTRDAETGKLKWGQLLHTDNSTFPVLLWRTFLWTFINVFFHVTGGMALALLLNRELALKGLYRTLIIIPWAVPQVIVALAWKGEFHSTYGFVNQMLGQIANIGIPGLFKLGDLCISQVCLGPQPWLKDQPWAFIATILVNVWLGIPFMMVIFLGGLQSIQPDFYEAADIDGATAQQKFWRITMPMMRPIVVPAITLGAIWTFNQFNIIYLITNGGPQEKSDILVTALFNAAIGNSRYGFGAAFSFVIFILLLLFAIGWLRLSGGLKGAYE
jgi:arabinogalactan oligomer / maltooligosaccharide transport system permease protein